MMSKNSKRKILTAAVLCAYTTMWANPAWAEKGNDNGGVVIINDGKRHVGVYGYYYSDDTTAEGGNVTADGEGTNETGGIYGGYSSKGAAKNNQVTINNGSSYYQVTGGYSGADGEVSGNTVTINGGESIKKVYGGLSKKAGLVSGNKVILNGGTWNGDVTGGSSKGNAVKNIVKVYGGQHGDNIDYRIVGGWVDTGGTEAKDNKVVIYDGIVSNVDGAKASGGDTIGNTVEIYGGTVLRNVCGGNSFDDPKGTGRGNSIGNKVLLAGGTIGRDWYDSNVYAGTSGNDGAVKDNIIELQNDVDLRNANLFGWEETVAHSGNQLIINGWTGKDVKSIANFDEVIFQTVEWKAGETLVNITDGEEKAFAEMNIKSDLTLAGGTELHAGEKMTFIQSNVDTGIDLSKVDLTESAEFTAGVAVIGTGAMELEGDTNNLVYKITGTEINPQTQLVAENRAVAAAFINQGTDLISDSLDVISRDGKYGIKTFAAVQGNRSKYDVNSDLKINGWSTIVGVGNENEHNGGDFSWGVFYENGSGNYRTFNSFNNEFFRGDGSLVYNGGGIAARYENAHGVYTEGSLRAGMLKSEMTNALRDGNGNNYGYKSESEYYGVHIGVGQIIPLTESSDLDVYGKFFHTYTQGDSFNVAGDEFEFDSINSDRLRVGARLTTNKENKFSTYYGLAYEYEFNGDAEMRAAGMDAPTQSLQGSSYMAEIGLNYQPAPDSPWSFDLNMRGYAGEREGATFNLQATYTF